MQGRQETVGRVREVVRVVGVGWGVTLVVAPLVLWVVVASLVPRLVWEWYAWRLDEVAAQV